ncbi:MAG: hypothetical protein PHW34_07625 [Hespellia sp.]|nr:hypothetical protein [Hespellia sp.]
MNKYQIQVDNDKNGFWDWIGVYAENDLDALLKATKKVYDEPKWKDYYISMIFSVKECTRMHKSSDGELIVFVKHTTQWYN